MMGPQHRLLGAFAGAGVASAAGLPWSMVALTGIVATTTAHGAASPDMDQTGTWRALTRWAPAALRKHRGLTHWWALPAAAWWAVGHHLPAAAHWPAYALLIGWASHLLGDALFGRIELWPGGPDFGLGLDTDGWLERHVARAAILAGLAWVLWTTPTWPGAHGWLPA